MSDNNQALSLEERCKLLEQELKKTKEESAAKDDIIAGQEEQLDAARAQGEGQLSVVTHGGKQYQVLAGQFSLGDEVIKHHELQGNTTVLKKLVEEKSPLLQLLEKPKAEKKA